MAMDENALLLGIEGMRSDANYYAAEVLRRKLGGAGAMVTNTVADGTEQAAARLLVVTWEGIAVLMRGVKTKDKIYEATPISHMFEALKPAIDHFRKECPEFAAEFEKLHSDYGGWLKKKKKSASYVSSACDGLLHARFG
jgi:hypothetical protein